MLRAVFVNLPVHPGGGLIVDLHPVHATVTFSGVRVLCEYEGQSDEAAAVFWPALDDREIQQRELALLQNDFLAGSVLHYLWEHSSHLGDSRHHFYFLDQSLRRLDVGDLHHSLTDFAVVGAPQSGEHSLATAEGVDQDRDRVSFDFFEQQGGASRLGDTIGYFGYFEIRVDFELNTLDFAYFLECADKLSEVVKGHSF